jgi:hypothetical protein
MKVLVVFEFKGVEPNSGKADQIIEQMTEACDAMMGEFDADACWIDDAVADERDCPTFSEL